MPANFRPPAPDPGLAGASAWIFMRERWLSVDEIARHLGVNPGTIYKWITRKSMPAHKLGRLWKFLATEVDAWVKAGKAAEDSPPTSRSNVKQGPTQSE